MLTPIAIKRITPCSKEEFFQTYVRANQPVVITGLVDNWAAMQSWNFDYFADHFGDVSASIGKYKNGLGYYNGAQDDRPVSECITSIKSGILTEGCVIISPISVFPDSIKNDYAAPAYCKDGKYLRSNISIGPRGFITPLHQDLPENLYVMVKGKKRITLFAPLDNVYPNSRLSNLPNHSQIDAEKPDYSKYPKTINAQPYIVDLCAGETLFIPSFWWHHLRNLEPSIALNFWWSQGWKLPIAWAAAIYKKYRKI